MLYNRGDIFYVNYTPTVGSEQRAGRPAIIVSNNKNNEHSPTLEVVYLTTEPKTDLPTHVTVRGTGIKSIALCEQIDTVSKERFSDFKGACSEEEMAMLDLALAISIGIEQKREESKSQPAPPALPRSLKLLCLLIRLKCLSEGNSIRSTYLILQLLWLSLRFMKAYA